MLRRSLLTRGAAVLAAGFCPALGRSARAAEAPSPYELTELRYQGWSSRVLFPELAEDLGYLAPITLKWVGNTFSGPQDIQTAVTGDTHFGSAFNGSIEKLIAAGAPIKAVIGSSGTDRQTWRGLYVLGGSPIKDPRGLIGRTIGVNTLGAHYEYMINRYLRGGGVTPAEIKQVTLVTMPLASQEPALRLKRLDAAILADVFRDKAVAAGGLDLLYSDYDLFGAFITSSYIMTRAFIARNPNTVRKFVEATARAIEWTRTHKRDEVIARFRDIIGKRGRNEDLAVVGFWQSPGLGGRGGVLEDRHFSLFLDWFREQGDAAVANLRPGDIYTNEFNPYRDGQSG